MIKASLMCFPGCYETEYDMNEMLSDSFDAIAEHFLKEDTGCPHCRVDRSQEYTDDRRYGSLNDWSDGYIDAVGTAYIEALRKFILDRVPNKVSNNEMFSIVFDGSWSPREYNFENDRCFVKVSIDLITRIKRLTESVLVDQWQEHLIKHFQSRSGFISFYSCDRDDWESIDLDAIDSVQAGAYLDFWLHQLPGFDQFDRDSYEYIQEKVDRWFSEVRSTWSIDPEYIACICDPADILDRPQPIPIAPGQLALDLSLT